MSESLSEREKTADKKGMFRNRKKGNGKWAEYVPADYGNYRLSVKEQGMFAARAVLLAAAAGWMFYDSLTAVPVLIPILLAVQLTGKKRMAEQRRWQLNMEFRDGLASVCAAVSAGYSAENAVGEALKDLKLIYREDAMIVREFAYMNSSMKNGASVESVFTDFAERSGVEDIASFSVIFSAAKRGGGNLVRILQKSSNKIAQKIEAKREIRILLSAKRYETLVLKGMPFGIILYLRLTSGEFLEPMYHNPFGIAAMSVLLVLYGGLCIAADRMMEIEV